jgi:hypothetical protein
MNSVGDSNKICCLNTVTLGIHIGLIITALFDICKRYLLLMLQTYDPKGTFHEHKYKKLMKNGEFRSFCEMFLVHKPSRNSIGISKSLSSLFRINRPKI